MSKQKENKLSKYMKVPIKMVVKFRDMSIRSMNHLSSQTLVRSGMAFGIPIVCHVSALPRSFSTSHAQYSVRAEENHLAKRVRAASARKTTVDTQLRPGQLKLRKAKSSRHVGGHNGFEKFDETSPLISFETKHKILERSKSYGVVKYNHVLQKL